MPPREGEPAPQAPANAGAQEADAAVTAARAARPGDPAAHLARELRRAGFRGEVSSDAQVLEKHALDYGRRGRSEPTLVVKPVDANDAATVVRLAQRTKTPIRNRGGGHGLEGQALVKGGIVLATDALQLPSGKTIELVKDASGKVTGVRLTPGLKVGDVHAFLAAQGYRLRSATMDTYPGVGGALAVGGVGLGGHRYGSMADQVMALTGVTGAGQVIRATSTSTEHTSFAGVDAKAAEAMLGGLGQFGTITEVTFPVVPTLGKVKLFRAPVASLEDLRKEIQTRVAAADDRTVAVWGNVVKNPQPPHQILYLASTLRDTDPQDPNQGQDRPQVPDPGADPSVVPAWMDIGLPSHEHAKNYINGKPNILDPLLSADAGMYLLIPQKKVRESLTLNTFSNARVGDDLLTMGFFLYYGGPHAQERAGERIEAWKTERADAVDRFGAQPYLMDGVPTTREGWRKVLGPNHEPLTKLLDELNPNGVFQRFDGLR